MVISMLKMRRALGRRIFNMEITIPGITVFPIETHLKSLIQASSLHEHARYYEAIME